MLLVIDIGNSNIKMALFKSERLLFCRRMTTDKQDSLSTLKRSLKRLLPKQTVENAQMLICSVVPKQTLLFRKALFLLFKKKALILGRDIIVPIKNLYKTPRQVGQDRLANALGAFNKYGGPVIVVDFGTALTFDVVSARGDYLGGVIVPGMELSLKALAEKAALLPQIDLARPKGLLGKETTLSIKSGLVYGFSFLIEGILRQLKKEFKVPTHVVATGGEAALMRPYCRQIDRVDENLTLLGIRLAYIKEKISKNE